MKDYTHKCPNCLLPKDKINDYFCIKNTGYCENCLTKRFNEKNNVQKREWRKNDVDMFAKFRPRNLSTVNKYPN